MLRPPAIAQLAVDLPSRVLTLADEASTEIARFDAELGTEVAPFAAILLRSESASSSRIENLTSSARAIALAELGSDKRQNSAEIVSNVNAMKAAIELADRIDEKAILEMHSALLIDHQPEIVGRWRDRQVWIGGNDYGPHQAAFVPPHHDRVATAMAERWSEVIEARRDAAVWRIMDLLLRQPVVDTALIERELAVTSANAGRALQQLATAGVTKEFSDRKRNRLWQAQEVLSALDEFAARAGRRG
jgi:Fic family protein